MKLKEDLERQLEAIYERVAARERWGVATTRIVLEEPPSLEQGDYATSIALKLASTLKRAPLEIAVRLLSEAQHDVALLKLVEVKTAPPGFLNLTLRDDILSASLKAPLLKFPKKKQTIVIDYSSPNVAKPMGVGHLRSTIIGDSLKRIHQAVGYHVVGVNHLGDWGTQMGKLILAWKRQAKKPRTIDIAFLLKLYIQFHADAEKHPELDQEARQETEKLQRGDAKNRALWKRFVAASYAELRIIYKRLGVRIESWKGESTYQPMLKGIVADALARGIARHSEGAVIIPFQEGTAPWVLQKSDGAYLYTTTDLAALRYRLKTYQPERLLYVVGNDQALHFEQLRLAAEALGYAPKETIVHVKFGLVTFEGKKLSTRAGRTVGLADLLNEAVRRADQLLNNRDFSPKERAAIAEAVGIGAVKYQDLSQQRMSDIAFDWERALSLSGNSAPYLQYVVVRIRSMIQKSKIRRPAVKKAPSSDNRGLHSETGSASRELMRRMIKFDGVVLAAAESCEPHRIAEYLFALSSAFNRFYEMVPVLDAPEPERTARLLLIRRVADTIETGLDLLGISVPEKM